MNLASLIIRGQVALRIVIIEDNEAVANGIAYVLRDEGHAVDLIFDGAEAVQFLRDDNADIVILDVKLPGLNGIEVLRDMRKRGDMRPVLMLTAQSSLSDKVDGLDAGADDYLAKPFEMSELRARLRALLRRGGAARVQTLVLGDLRFDPTARQIIGPQGPLELPRREVAMFEALLMAQTRTVSKQILLDKVYGTGADVDEQVVEVYISRLRGRLKPFKIEIKMQRGLGYCMQASTP
uniref:response regulator transcription factor n=1 Tax=Yoonia sp. TaxID=2212373 RepID=UPI004047A97F